MKATTAANKTPAAWARQATRPIEACPPRPLGQAGLCVACGEREALGIGGPRRGGQRWREEDRMCAPCLLARRSGTGEGTDGQS